MELILNVGHVEGSIPASVRFLERVKRCFHVKWGLRFDIRQFFFGGCPSVLLRVLYDAQSAGRCELVLLLPLPESVVNKAKVEEEDWIKTRCLVIAHVTIRAEDGVSIIIALLIEASDREMNSIVWAFEGHNIVRLVPTMIRDPLCCRGSVRKNGVIGSIEAELESVEDAVRVRHGRWLLIII